MPQLSNLKISYTCCGPSIMHSHSKEDAFGHKFGGFVYVHPQGLPMPVNLVSSTPLGVLCLEFEMTILSLK